MIVVTATMRTMVVYTSPVNTPDDNPTPATINPTSPLEIIPIPTLTVSYTHLTLPTTPYV